MVSAGDALYAAFVRADQDSEDRYLAIMKYNGTTGSEPVLVDSNSILDDSPASASTAPATFGWTMHGPARDGRIRPVCRTAVAAEGITREYAIVGNSIYYSAVDENSANLMVLPYRVNALGLPIQLTGDARFLENLFAARSNGQDYVFGMSTAETTVTLTVTNAGDHAVTSFDVLVGSLTEYVVKVVEMG